MKNRTIVIGNLLLSVFIYAALISLIYFFELKEYAQAHNLSFLPAFNATCNAIAATFITLGIFAIKSDRKKRHAGFMILATTASAAFLVGYITHHTVHGDTHFNGTGILAVLYFSILITHILTSAIALPLILTTLSYAALKRFKAHQSIARWTYPLWLYVSITGVLIWIFLRHLNPIA